MISLDELLLLDDNTILTGANEQGKPYLNAMIIYFEHYLNACASCRHKYPEYLQRLREMEKQKTKQNKQGNFQLKKGALIIVQGSGECYSEFNMTDKTAIRVLKQNPNTIALFETYPEHWEDMLTPKTRRKAK